MIVVQKLVAVCFQLCFFTFFTAMLPKIAVFGTNTLAAALITELQRLGFEIVGLWDQILKTAVTWCEHFHIPLPTDSIEVLLKDQEVDLVLVCAPPHTHKEITTKALAAGKHVICEPPLGLTGSDNAAIMELAVYYPSLTLSTFGFRHLTGVRKAKDLIENGTIGRLQSFEVSLHCGPSDVTERLNYDWTCIRELNAGPLFSSALHLIDLKSFLFSHKHRTYTVCGTVRRFQSNPSHFKYDEHLTREDFISWEALLEGDIPSTTTINNNFPGKFDLKFIINGTKSSLIIENNNLYREIPGKKDRELICPLIDNVQSTNQLPVKSEIETKFDYRHPQLIVAGVVAMCSSLKEAFEPLTERRRWTAEKLAEAGSFRDCQYARAVVDAVKRSSETRRWTEVRIPTKTLDGGSLTVSLTRFSGA